MITLTNPQYRIISDHQFAVVRQNLVNNQKAFFAQRSYQPGDVIADFLQAVLSEPAYLTVQVGIDKHIMLTHSILVTVASNVFDLHYAGGSTYY
jgi:hypothetical protein